MKMPCMIRLVLNVGFSQTVIQLLHHLERDLRVCIVIVRALRSRLGEIVETLELRSLDICCVQGTRFRGKSVRMISGKAGEYKLFHIGNGKGLGGVGSFLAKR